MKGKYLFLCILAFVFASCQNTEPDNLGLELSESTFENVSSDGATLSVNITSSSSWTATTSSAWCSLTPKQGSGSQSVSISVGANLNSSPRTATIDISSNGLSKKITVTQQAASNPPTSDSYHYNLPVIFHVLYKDKTNPEQYLSQTRIAQVLDVVNKIYQNKVKSVDMNLTFTLATSDPDGNPLTTPGVEYIQWPENYPIDCDAFMTDNSGKYVKYLWDPNAYINVMLYNFVSSNPSTVTLGISHLPYATAGSTFLEGLNEIKLSYIDKSNLKYPYSLSINSLFINRQSAGTTYTPYDVTVTLAHELGHYLGLHHAFSENENGYFDGCSDSDYCEDTPTYNKIVYDKWVGVQRMAGVRDLATLALRENCRTGQEFTSHNLMDYAYSYSDQFTNDQRNRIRHVLTYSPLIPGPKQGPTRTRSVEGPLDLPIRTMR